MGADASLHDQLEASPIKSTALMFARQLNKGDT